MVVSRGRKYRSHLLASAPSPKVATVSAQVLARAPGVRPPRGPAAAQAVSDAVGPVSPSSGGGDHGPRCLRRRILSSWITGMLGGWEIGSAFKHKTMKRDKQKFITKTLKYPEFRFK